MKLIILLAVSTCAFAAKLDRTYLPPPGAETAGGSPGSLNAPHGSQTAGPSFGSPFSGANQPSGQNSQGPFAPTFGGQRVQGSNVRGNQVQVTPFEGQGIQSGLGNRGSSSFPNQASGNFEKAPLNFDQNTKPSNQDLAGNPDFRQTYSQPERAQAAQDRTAETIRYDNEIDGDSFAYSFETSNGISAEESGVATNGVQAKGAFSYTGDDGQLYSITYTADENGYQPHGDHLPTPPPIPEEILRSLEENARAAAAGTQEGAYNEEENYSSSQYDGHHPGASSQQYKLQQSSNLSNQYGAPNAQQPAAQQKNTQFDANLTPSNNREEFQRPGADQSFNRPQFTQGSQVNKQQTSRPSNQYGAPEALPTSPQGPSADQSFNRPQFIQGSTVNQQSPIPSNQHGVPTAQRPTASQSSDQFYNSNSPSNNRQNFQRPGADQSFNRPQFNQASQFNNQKSASPSNQYGSPSQSNTKSQQASSTDRYSSSTKQQAPQRFQPSTQFNQQSGYQYDRPLTKASGAQPSQSSNFNMQISSAPGQKYTSPTSQNNQSAANLHRPQGSVSSFETSGRLNQPAGFKMASQNYPTASQQYKAPSKSGQDFSGPRQPPSFSPEEGYKY